MNRFLFWLDLQLYKRIATIHTVAERLGLERLRLWCVHTGETRWPVVDHEYSVCPVCTEYGSCPEHPVTEVDTTGRFRLGHFVTK